MRWCPSWPDDPQLVTDPDEEGSRGPEVAGVVVITSVCSHVLLKSARQRAAASRCEVRYVAQPSISAIQRALSEIAEVRCAA